MESHIRFDRAKLELALLDQRILPARISEVICRTSEEAIKAIQNMTVRGAPAIGVTAAFACVLALVSPEIMQDEKTWTERLGKKLAQIRSARPTAVNLAWAVDRMEKLVPLVQTPADLLSRWLDEAEAIQREDIAICKKLGAIGASVIKSGDTVLTHCNAGALATAGHGTALGVIRSAIEQGKNVHVIADETRPFMQGSRLTAWELEQDHIPVTIACDDACGHLMASGLVQLVITGADRIAANGDTANKIGTLGVAIMASYFHIPFYIAAPLSTIDRSTPTGAQIPIEARDPSEVSQFAGNPVAPKDIPVYNFAFDVTPASLITGIITEAGILAPPYDDSIARAFAGNSNGAQ